MPTGLMDHTDENTDEVRSLRANEVALLFDESNFPMETRDVLKEFGDLDVEYPRGSDPLRAILERSGDETYTTRNDLELAILNGVRRDAVGRARYSDRGDEVSQQLDRTDESF